MEFGDLSKSELPNEVEDIELPDSFELTLDSFIMDPSAWMEYLAQIIAKALEGKDQAIIDRFMDSIESYIIMNKIENNPEIDSETLKNSTEILYISLFRFVMHYLYGFDKN